MSATLSTRMTVLQLFAQHQGENLENPRVYAAMGATDYCDVQAIHKCMSRLVNEGNLRLVKHGTRTITDAGVVASTAKRREPKTKAAQLEAQRVRDRAKRAALQAAIAASMLPEPTEKPVAEPVDVDVIKWVSKASSKPQRYCAERVVPDICCYEVRERIGYINTMWRPASCGAKLGGRV